MWQQFRHLLAHGDGLLAGSGVQKLLVMNGGKTPQMGVGVIIPKVYLSLRMQKIVNGSC